MVDTSKIVPMGSNWLKPDVFDSLTAQARQKGVELLFTVVPGSGIDEKDFVEQGPSGSVTKHSSRPWITLVFDNKDYKWGLSPTANQIVGLELGFETDAWVGAVLKLFPDVVAGKRTLKAVVVSHPPKLGKK